MPTKIKPMSVDKLITAMARVNNQYSRMTRHQMLMMKALAAGIACELEEQIAMRNERAPLVGANPVNPV